MGKQPKIDGIFKKLNSQNQESNENEELGTPTLENYVQEIRPTKSLRIDSEQFSFESIDRDPGKRKQIWEYSGPKLQNEVRRYYLSKGPYQPLLSEYPKSGPPSHPRRFQSSWYTLFPSWLEYSPTKDAAFCLNCFLYNDPNGRPNTRAFTIDGFRNWKNVRNGLHCSFLKHVGKDPNFAHNDSVQACQALLNQKEHLPQALDKQTSKQIADNRLRLGASVDAALFCAFQGIPLRGHDESSNSLNRGNFIEQIKVIAKHNPEVAAVVLDKAPRNATYTSPDTQKEILEVLAEKVKRAIHEEIGDDYFCIIVDEASDVAKREQMAIVLRYVDKFGVVRERFFCLVHVPETSSLTLKNEIFAVLSRYGFDIQKMRGQGYDGASNMRGEWNGLQALVSNECPYAYYIHCFAHRLQLALVAAAKEVTLVHQFFTKLTSIVTFVTGSCKRNDELRDAQVIELASLMDSGELKIGTGLNQISNLKRPGDTRWGSHLKSIDSLMKLFKPTCAVLNNLIEEGNASQRADAETVIDALTSFEFVFVLHLMKEVMEITDLLCQALQRKSQDIANALHLVMTTKNLIQHFRDDGWDTFLTKVLSFCESHQILVPDMSTRYVGRRGRARNQIDIISVGHHYRVDIFYAAIDYQLQELNSRFSDKSMELLTLCCTLDPRQWSTSFPIDDIYKLAQKFYKGDFTELEIEYLRVQLRHFELNRSNCHELRHLSSTSELSQWFVESRKSEVFPLLFKLIKLVLTLPVSTATTERAFSAMSIVKTKLRNKMEDEFLDHCCVIFIEREIAKSFSTSMIINDFRDMKERRALL